MKKYALLTIAIALAGPLVLNAAPEPVAVPKPIACDHSDSTKQAAAQPAEAVPGDAYMLSTDPVSGEALPEKPVIAPYEGRELRFATQANADLFMKEPARYLPRVDSLTIAAQLPLYPMDTCVVSGEKLTDQGDMGPPVNYVYRNRLVRLCCGGCISRLKKDPAKYLGALDEAVLKAQSGTYPVKTCVVTGEDLTAKEKPFVFVTGNQMVKLCCKHCLTTFNSNPAGYLAAIRKS